MNWVELGRYDRNLAHIIVGRLVSEGIAAVPFDDGTGLVEGSFLLVPVRVMVDEGDLATARAIVGDA